MSEHMKAKVDGSVPAEGQSDASVPGGYVPPRLTRVGNVRELLAGNGGTQPDADPTAIDNQQG